MIFSKEVKIGEKSYFANFLRCPPITIYTWSNMYKDAAFMMDVNIIMLLVKEDF